MKLITKIASLTSILPPKIEIKRKLDIVAQKQKVNN